MSSLPHSARSALIFAAGLGERMRPLTDITPKPLLMAGGQPLIVWHLQRLAALGVREVVINTSWLAAQFPQTLGDGSRWGVRIRYSYEGATPLETGGGMLHALPQLSGDNDPNQPFVAINGDIWCDADLAALSIGPHNEAHLLLVENPPHHPRGDFCLRQDGYLASEGEPMLTFSGIGLYRPSLFAGWRAVIGGDAGGANADPPRFKLAPLLHAAMGRGAVSGSRHYGRWTDVGTPQRLAELNDALKQTRR